jgi:hypothetical protein
VADEEAINDVLIIPSDPETNHTRLTCGEL